MSCVKKGTNKLLTKKHKGSEEEKSFKLCNCNADDFNQADVGEKRASLEAALFTPFCPTLYTRFVIGRSLSGL